MKLQPNDPCWCGSGKKYKKCHKTSDEQVDKLKAQGFKFLPKKNIKTPEQIEGIRKAGLLVHKTLDLVAENIKEGMNTEEINKLVHEFTLDNGAIPAPLNYRGFPKSTCTSINNVVCHGIPSEKEILKDGDIVNVDITSILNGYYADSSRMYCIGNVSDEAQKLVDITKECLEIGIQQVKPYNQINNIGHYIENYANKHGYSVVRDLCGHGIGLDFHEEPEIVHYSKRRKGVIMVPGMVFTIEPMINAGKYKCHFDEDDGWTVTTADGSLSAQWEHTILVTNTGYEILT